MNFRVEMERKRSINESQNQRKRVEYVAGKTETEARLVAAKRCPEFVVVSVRRA